MRFAALGRHHVTVPGRTATLLAELGHPDLMQPLRGQRPCVWCAAMSGPPERWQDDDR